MYIIIKCFGNKEEILNIIYKDEFYIHAYIKNYIDNYIKNNKDNEFIIENVDNVYVLKSKNIKSKKGYIYNTQKTSICELFSIKFLEYTHSGEPINEDLNLFPEIIPRLEEEYKKMLKIDQYDLNFEIIKRIVKKLDATTLNQIFLDILDNIHLKDNWTKKEIINMFSDVLKDFKKELYSSIVKKLNRYGKKSKS